MVTNTNSIIYHFAIISLMIVICSSNSMMTCSALLVFDIISKLSACLQCWFVERDSYKLMPLSIWQKWHAYQEFFQRFLSWISARACGMDFTLLFFYGDWTKVSLHISSVFSLWEGSFAACPSTATINLWYHIHLTTELDRVIKICAPLLYVFSFQSFRWSF